MITDAILTFLINLVRQMFSLLPEWTVDLSAFENFSFQMSGALAWANGYFPVTTLGIVLTALIAFKVGSLVWRGAIFVWSMIPGKAT